MEDHQLNPIINVIQLGLAVLNGRILTLLGLLLIFGAFLFPLVQPSVLSIVAASMCGILTIGLIAFTRDKRA